MIGLIIGGLGFALFCLSFFVAEYEKDEEREDMLRL